MENYTVFTQLKERARRTVAALTAAALLAGTAVLGLAAPASAADSSGAPLVWGVESVFRNHFKPFTTASAGASLLDDGKYSYSYGSSAVSGGTGATQFAGSIDVNAYGGAYVAQLQSPEVNLTSPTAGILSVTSNGVKVALASFAVSTPTETDGTLHYTASNVSLLASGVPLFGNYYREGNVFDNFTFGIPAPSVQQTTTTLGLPTTATVGQSVTITATVSPAASGTVSFFANGSLVGDVTAASGAASVSYTPTVAGSQAIRAEFTSTDTAFESSTADGTLVVAAKAPEVPVIPPFTTEPAPASAVGTLKWQVSGQFWKHLTVRDVTGGTAVEADTFSFPVVSFSGNENAKILELSGKVRGAFANRGTTYYWVEFSNLEARQVSADSWNLYGTVSAAVAVATQAGPVSYQTTDDVLIGSFGAAQVVEGATVTSTTQAFDQLMNALPAPLQGHFDSKTDVKKMAPVTIALDAAVPVDRFVAVSGSGFINLPDAQSGPSEGAYLAVVEAGTDITTITMRSALAVSFVPNALIVNGAFTQTLKVPAAHAGKDLEVVAWSAHGNASAATLIDRKPVTASNTVALKYAAGGTEEPETPVDPEVPTTPEAPEAQAGSLQWGVKKSFRDYLKMPMSGGQIILSGAAQNADGSVFAFPQASSNFAGSTGTVRYSGSVRFTGHDGALDTKLDKPYVVVTGPTTGELYATVSAKHMTDPSKAVTNKVLKVADLTFGKPVTNADGSYTFKTTKVLLAASGVAAFSDFYKTGEVLDNLTFIAGSNSTQGGGPTGSTDGFTATVSASTVTPGQTVTLTGRGFAANASGINAYLYSTPVLLAQNLKANAEGVVTVKVTIPANTVAGQHTLSLEAGTNKAQVSITVKAATTGGLPSLGGDDDDTSTGTGGTDEPDTEKEPVCVARAVSGASLNWGLRSSYIRYVDNLSDGVVSATGSVRRAGSTFAWSGGSGKYNVDANKGLVYFGGKLHFAGHDDAMNSTFSNIRIQFASSGTAYVLADVVAKGLDTPGLTKNGAHIATVSLSGNKSASGSKITWTNAPVTLTSTGAAAFGGFYEAGESLDSMTISVPLGATTDCDAGSGTLAATGAEDGTSAAALAAVALMFAGLALVAVRRNRGVATAR